MRLAPDGSEVRITMPRWGRTEDALVFARARLEWLERQLAALPQAQTPRPGGMVHYRGERLAIDWDPAHPRGPRLAGASVRIGGPAENLPRRASALARGRGAATAGGRISRYYCARAGHVPPPLRLSRAQRRWGSCSDRRTIRINWRLVQAPDFVRRSVVAHEVAHLTHFDHSPAFHALLAGLFDGEVHAADAWLKAHGRALYAPSGDALTTN